ncbi:AGAP011376-PA [Anopheles gambiae str. PEST]|uniref:AGAP011376-PA n=3 Tax=gambiae species complex TaxID=44542 RepID=A0NFC2_ANOGA|nr:AGAP011376-PA [Anopheles gambiae str. PEST]
MQPDVHLKCIACFSGSSKRAAPPTLASKTSLPRSISCCRIVPRPGGVTTYTRKGGTRPRTRNTVNQLA